MYRKQSILIIEDNLANIGVLQTMLEEKYSVFVVRNGKIALKMIDIQKPDLILLDLTLPDMHGFEILKLIKDHGDERISNIPVIITTGDTDQESEIKGLQLGASDYICKPYNSIIVTMKVSNQIKMINYRDKLEYMVDKKTNELKMAYNAVTTAMSLLINEKDNGTGNHINKTQKYVKVIIDNIDPYYIKDLDDSTKEHIITFSPIHDIGKISINDSILLKPAKLTEDEFKIMQQHTINGGRVLRKTKELFDNNINLDVAIEMAECHHEKFDGSGYPFQLKGNDIPLCARILSICDVYDALTNKREYKKTFSHKEACNILINGDGRTEPDHFDPYVLEAFIRSENIFEYICNN